MNILSNMLREASSRFGLPILIVGLIAIPPALGQLPDPVAHYTFDEGLENYTLDTAIDSANGNNGVWQNTENTDGLSYAIGQIGGAVHLRGLDGDFFRVPSIPQIDGIEPSPLSGTPVEGVGITFSAWMYAEEDAPSGYKGILMSRTVTDDVGVIVPDQNWGLAWEGGDHLDARVSGQGIDSADIVDRGQWHHLAMVWGNVEDSLVGSFYQPGQILYVDGVKQEVFDDNTNVYALVSSGQWNIGDDDECTGCRGREFDGLLDDLAIFPEALSDAEIATLYNNGTMGIDAAGNNTGIIEEGDLDGGGVGISDFQIIRDNIGLEVNARSLGDLNGNRRVDLNDFRIWLNSVPPALAAEALGSWSATVPEPSSVLLAVAAAALFLKRQRFRQALLVLLAAGMLCPTIGHAQDLLLRVDRGTGALQLTGTSATTVDLAGYIIESEFGTLDVASGNFTGLRAIDSNYDVAGPQTSFGISELYELGDNPAGILEVNDAIVLNLGNFYDLAEVANVELAGGFGFNAEVGDFTLTYADPNQESSITGLVEFVGDRDLNTLVLTVDTSTGEAILENESAFDQVVIGYSISAGSPGILNTNLSTFTGLRAYPSGSLFQSPATLNGDALGELDPTQDQAVAGIPIDAGQSYDLGVIGDVSGNLEDLVGNLSFNFILAGVDELERAGSVKYATAGNPGDFNGDGNVDGVDFLAWQRGESPSPLSASDLADWQSNYGAGLQLAAASAVPEPTCSILAVIVLMGGALGHRRAIREQ